MSMGEFMVLGTLILISLVLVGSIAYAIYDYYTTQKAMAKGMVSHLSFSFKMVEESLKNRAKMDEELERRKKETPDNG